MLIFYAEKIESVLTPAAIIEAVREGIGKHTSGVYQVPKRTHIENGNITQLMMPAGGVKYACMKRISVVPENARQGLPTIRGTLLLEDAGSGMPLAAMDAPMITALRTAAIGALGLDLISSNSLDTIGVIGLGVQGLWQTIFACSVRELKKVCCYSRTRSKFDHYKSQLLNKCPDLEIEWCESAEEVVESSNVIYTCTTSTVPVISDNEVLVKNKAFISVGSFRKDMQELPNVVYQQADLLILDTLTAKEEVGDVINALDQGLINEDQIISLGDALEGTKRIGTAQSPVFKSVGMAAFDLALAAAIYEKEIES